jgi:hypothetical protein
LLNGAQTFLVLRPSRDNVPAEAINLGTGGPSGENIDLAVRLFIVNVVGHF